MTPIDRTHDDLIVNLAERALRRTSDGQRFRVIGSVRLPSGQFGVPRQEVRRHVIARLVHEGRLKYGNRARSFVVQNHG
jgi:hypothetical protein